MGQINLAVSDSAFTDLKFQVKSPQLWSPEAPHLYKLVVTLKSGGKVTDTWEGQVGIRYFRFDAQEGFFLNGKNI